MKPYIRSAVVFIISSVGWIIPPGVSNGQIKATVREEATCKEIGFAPKTEAFGNCVMELLSRNGGGPAAPSRQPAARQPASTPAPRAPRVSSPVVAVAVPETPNGRTCVTYGFKVGTTAFAQCQMDLDAAQRQAESQQQRYQLQAQQYQLEVQQYQQQVAGYEAQAAAIKKERDRRKWEMLARVGAGMMSSNSPSFLGGLSDGMAAGAGLPVRPPPVAPPAPVVQNYTIRTPTGAQVYCTYNSAARYMSCR